MDILDAIREKIKGLPQDDQKVGLKAVVIHIETAERYLDRAKAENDENLFTDVIYRTNHAFEGILKEAYSILTGQDASRKTPYEIESYLLGNSVFRPRVMDLFRNYRTEWRNPSTHDYKLFFSEQESFLAIVSVSAFVNILLDQVIEHMSYEAEKAKTSGRVEAIKSSIPGYESLPLVEKLKELLIAFSNDLIDSPTHDLPVTEYEVSGSLSGFIASVDPALVLEQEKSIHIGKSLVAADLAVSFGNECTIVELKRTVPVSHVIARAEQQLIAYLAASNVHNGILYFVPLDVDSSMVVEEEQIEIGEAQAQIVRIFPNLD